jgi:isopentenyl-diphosphate delta-isomerase
MTEEFVILVDAHDREVGVMEKMEAHRKGVLHRALSVMVFNSRGEILLQKRAESKYHSGGLWTNTCCSHPRPGESVSAAASRRLKEEMGIELQLNPVGSFVYRAELDKALIEHELDHVFTGRFDGNPIINTHEVVDWKFISLTSLEKDMIANPNQYTEWFKIILSTWDLQSISQPQAS